MPSTCDNGHVISQENPLVWGERSGRRCFTCLHKLGQRTPTKTSSGSIANPPTSDPGNRDPRFESPATMLCQRLLAQCSDEPNGCWLWQGPTTKTSDGRTVPVFTMPVIPGWNDMEARGVVFVVLFGYPRPNTRLFAECNNELCLQPDHMIQVKR